MKYGGNLPNNQQVQDGYLFGVEILDLDDESIEFRFESKNSPPIRDILTMSEIFQFSFELTYENEGEDSYGVYKFQLNEEGDYIFHKEIPFEKLPERIEDENDLYYNKVDELLKNSPFDLIKYDFKK